MASVIGDLLLEMDAEKVRTLPILQGLEKLLLLEQPEEVRTALSVARDRYSARVDKLHAALRTCRALVGDEYPALPEYTVPQTVTAEIVDDKDDILAALGQFNSEAEATEMLMTFKDPT